MQWKWWSFAWKWCWMLGIIWNYEIVGQHRHLNHDTPAEQKGGIFPECDHKCGKPSQVWRPDFQPNFPPRNTEETQFPWISILFLHLFLPVWNSNHSQLQFASGLCHHFLLVRPYQQDRNNSWDSMVINASLIPKQSSQMPMWLASFQMSNANFFARQCLTESKSKSLIMMFGSWESRMPLLKNERMFASRI